uniref:Uncharacterized protein ycf18 n=1 Tax=Ophidocladus simpliciusculus TaxID=1261574 RepID=A0A1Z1MIQ3_9FLOR|nr:phycobilisome degradation protein [Ophidocladus simpliciusculus]ARW65957.1 phycobilisome degradation protein [Ophidocladus simpliciusculus]
MKNSSKLTLEQEFKIELYKTKINELNSINTKKYLISILKRMIIKNNIIKYCIKNITN